MIRFALRRILTSEQREGDVDDNNENLLYFEASSMKELHQIMSRWQAENRKRLLSTSV